MTNTQRGETAIQIAGRAHVLRLTLAALAEIEAGLECDGLEALSTRLSKLDAQALNIVLTALLRGGGAPDAEALAGEADASTAAQSVAACFKSNLA
ncbi:MAG: GTA-gp10 family protein [Oceanicaulis sp.]